MKILGIILARAGSKRLPGKNTKTLIDKPLIEWTIQAAVNSKIDKTILSTDCLSCKMIAEDYGIEVYDRTDHLASDTTTSADVILDLMKNIKGFTHILLLQPTSPLRTADDIDGIIRYYQIVSKYYEKITVVSANIKTRNINGALYMSEWNQFLEDKKFEEDYIYWMTPEKSIDIDTQEDFEKAEKILRGGPCPV